MPKEIQCIKFVKPRYKKRSREEDDEPSDQGDGEMQPCLRIRIESGPQDPPRLSSQKLFERMHKLVPNACLFTIVKPPTADEPPVAASSDSGASVEQLIEPTDVPPNSNDIGQPESSNTVPDSEANIEQLSEADVKPIVQDNQQPIVQDNQQPELSDALPDAETVIEQPIELTDLAPVAADSRQPESSNTLPENEADIEQPSGENIKNRIGELLPTSEALADTETSQCDALPSPLTDYFRTMCNEDDVTNTAKQLFYSLNITKQECRRIEEATRMQRDCTEWFQQREGRLTASSFHSVLNMRKQTDPATVAKKFLNKQNISHIPAIRWGISNEERARQDYISAMSSHTNFECIPVGLVINPLFPYLGASPDGLIKCECCHGSGLIEIKCPCSIRDAHPNTLRCKPQSCLGEVGMAMSHAYYTQVQGQLLITGKEYCDFVVWTPKGIIIDRVYQDSNFTEKLLRKLTSFYVEFMIPAIVGPTLDRSSR